MSKTLVLVAPEAIAAAAFDWPVAPIRIAQDPAEALDLARQSDRAEDLICVTGSLFLAAESRGSSCPMSAVR